MAKLAEPETAEVAASLADGRGVVRGEGKTLFVRGALAGERVRFVRRRRRRRFDEAELLEVLRPSPQRVAPRCAVFGQCGGCSLQHLASADQVAVKQEVLLDNLARIGGLTPERVLPPVIGPAWGYRRKARLAVKDVPRKGRVLVGFREHAKPYVTDAQRCETLHPAVGERLAELSDLIGSLSIRARLPQIEVAIGDTTLGADIVLVLRVLDPPSTADVAQLTHFAHRTGWRLFLQSAGPDSITAVPGTADEPLLSYRLPAFDLSLQFGPTDFVQVNATINSRMIDLALELLDVGPDSRVLDLYCGLGNFTLPLGRRAGSVLGIEGDAQMVRRAADNASRAGLANLRFEAADLSAVEPLADFANQAFDRVLLDPPRTGAAEVLSGIARFAPPRVVYVSCHPGTLARDAGRLVQEFGYRLAAAGIMDMFPQTSHVESIALFERV